MVTEGEIVLSEAVFRVRVLRIGLCRVWCEVLLWVMSKAEKAVLYAEQFLKLSNPSK